MYLAQHEPTHSVARLDGGHSQLCRHVHHSDHLGLSGSLSPQHLCVFVCAEHFNSSWSSCQC